MVRAPSWPHRRGDFALDPGLSLLNHGSFGAVPRDVLRAQQRERAAMEADPVRWMEATGPRLRAVANGLAPWFGARGRDLVFVRNTTTGVNTVLASMALRPGDRLVTTSLAYPAVRAAMVRWATKAGATVEVVDVPFPDVTPEGVVAAVAAALPGARLAVLDAIASSTGLVLPVEALVGACRDHGVPVLVDAAHVPGQVALDLTALGADWVVGNLHKWLFAPKGTAVLWTRPDRQGQTEPLVTSLPTARVYPDAFDWQGTDDVTGWLVVPEAQRYVARRGGLDALVPQLSDQATTIRDWLEDAWGVVGPAPASMQAAMVLVPVPGDLPGHRAKALHAALEARGIEVYVGDVAGRAWLRVSAQLHVRPEDVARLVEAVPSCVASIR